MIGNQVGSDKKWLKMCFNKDEYFFTPKTQQFFPLNTFFMQNISVNLLDEKNNFIKSIIDKGE